jgi:hypothetical protein
MHSSISNFSNKHPMLRSRGEIACLLLITAFILIAVECAARVLILPKSKIECRIESELNSALSTHHTGKNHTVLILGNSLLGKGVDMDALKASLPLEWKAKRLFIEDTNYYDWYYGMKRLFSGGSQPDAIVLMLGINQLVKTSVRSEYFAHRLLQLHDLPNIAHDVQLHPTATFGLFTGNLSSFYGTRVEIRKQVLGLLLPDFANLTQHLTPSRTPNHQAEAFEKELRPRFAKLKQLNRSSSIPIALLIAPEPGLSNELLQTVQRVGSDMDIAILVPLKPDNISVDDFSDGFHLNANGATKFTTALANILKCYLPKLRS